MKKFLAAALASMMLIGGAALASADGELNICSPNSDGLLSIIPVFEEQTGIKVKVESIGTGDCMKRIDTILVDLSRDMWTYISMEYFKQQIKAGEVGSSAMPHKVNPIDFENAEGNFGIANAVFEHLASKLPVSRLQRDLTDSTVLRNIGVPMAHAVIALQSLLKGLNKVILNPEALARDLENNWAVVAEGIQTILRREGFPKPYEALKALTRTNAHITRESIAAFIETLDVAESVKEELRALSPSTYTGVFR